MKQIFVIIIAFCGFKCHSQINNDTMLYHYITTTKFENIFLNRRISDSVIRLYFYTLDSQSYYDTIVSNDSTMVSSKKRVVLYDEVREDNPIYESDSQLGYFELTKYSKFEPYYFTIDKSPLFIYVFNDTFINKMKIVRYDKQGLLIQEKFYIRDIINEPLYNYKRKRYMWKIDRSNQKW